MSALPIMRLGGNHPDDLAVAFRLGANNYIIKPVPINVLLARLAAVLRRTKANTYQPRRQNDFAIAQSRFVLPAAIEEALYFSGLSSKCVLDQYVLPAPVSADLGCAIFFSDVIRKSS
ncbi:MAG: hypothetical protein R3E79_62020 [Caldilineaceae bacterium]